MGVRVSFLEKKAAPTAQAPSGVLVPAKAVVQRDGHEVVFVVQDGHVRQRRVQPQPAGELRRLPEGVQPGETVVVSPPDALRDGMAVRVSAGS
jgi:multidrug efflux pump subunit AcrA (membrane-fusion protein)